MRRPRYKLLTCTKCGHQDERLIETNDDDTPIDVQVCLKTTNVSTKHVPATDEHGEYYVEAADSCLADMTYGDTMFTGYMKTITKGNHDFNERERERLEKRGDEHWKREGRHEAIERERAILKKNGMDGAGGVR
jgi:hypothetical protein